MDVHGSEQRRRNMQAIRSSGTKVERLFGSAIWRKGYRYRKNDKKVFGTPDFVLKRYKLAIFIDSEFFHGRDWLLRKFDIRTNQDFWWKKIEANIQRDIRVNEYLAKEGWLVLRFWDKDVIKNITSCLQAMEKITLEFTTSR